MLDNGESTLLRITEFLDSKIGEKQHERTYLSENKFVVSENKKTNPIFSHRNLPANCAPIILE